MNVAVLGTGRLGSALVEGWYGAGVIAPASLRLYNPSRSKPDTLAKRFGASVFASPREAAEGADAVVLCMKPHLLPAALTDLNGYLPGGCLVISVAAGVKTATMEALLTPGISVARALPTTAARIRQSATALCAGASAGPGSLALATSLFEPLGVCAVVTEAQMDGALGVASSGIAFAYLFAEALIDGGVRAGLPRDQARLLAVQTLFGAAAMMQETGEHPGALKDAVTTPGGTTIAGLEVLENSGVRGAVMGAVRAAAERSRELG